MLLFLSLLSLFLTVTAEFCYSGSLFQEEIKNSIDSSSWYLNLASPSSCSGEIDKYEVEYYVPSNDGDYVTYVAMWEPGDSNTSYNMVSGSRKKLEVEVDDKKRKKRALGYKAKSISSVYIRKGTIVAVYFQGGNKLPVLGSATPGEYSVCQLSGSKNEASLDCTSEHIDTSLVIHAQAKIRIIDCGKLSITHGSVAYINDTEYGAIAQYSCNVGFEFSQNGDVYRECKKNGQWNGTSPSCEIVSCGPPNTIPNGEQTGDSYTFGSNITVSCKPGYELIGNSLITCLVNKIWSDNNLTCTVGMCEDLGTLLNGHLSSQNFSYASVVSFTCNLGYVLNGDDKIICQESGNWNGYVPSCVPVNCSDPGEPSNGLKIGNSFSFGSNVTFSCNEGYELNDTSGIICIANATWNASIPHCSIIDCSNPGEPDNGMTLGQNFSYNSVVSFFCENGYNLNGSETIVCNSDKQWNSSLPRCDPVDCGIPFEDENTIVVGASSTFLSIVHYECLPGYELNGSSVLICQVDGQWNASSPNCNPINCGNPGKPNNSSIASESLYTFGSVIVYECDEGFEMSGWLAIECLANKQWNGTIPNCSLTICNPPYSPENGYKVGTSYAYKSQIDFHCDEGYVLVGNSSIVCTLQGIWNGSTPICSPINCGSPDIPDNGEVIGESYTFGSDLEYKCNIGFTLTGSKTSECIKNGTWNPIMPLCDLVDCGNPGIPDNGLKNGASFEYGSNVTFSCNDGYILDGSKFITCQSNGNWTSSTPICSPVNCSDPGTPSNGQQNNSVPYTFGSHVVFSCLQGYELSGSNIISCQADGNWSNSLPSCSIINCGPPQPPLNGTVLGTVYTYNSTVTFDCQTGYMLQGSSFSVCLDNREWSYDTPRCLRPCSALQSTSYLFLSPIKDVYVDGDKVTFWCSTGYELKGNSAISCNSVGHWSGLVPICIAAASYSISTSDYTKGLSSSPSSTPNNTINQQDSSVVTYCAVIGGVLFLIIAIIIAMILLLFYVRNRRSKQKYDVQNPASDTSIVNPMIHSDLYDASTSVALRAQTLHTDMEEMTDMTPSPYEVPLTMQREKEATLLKKDLSSTPPEMTPDSSTASLYEVPLTMQKRQSAALEKRDQISSKIRTGRPVTDPLDFDIPPPLAETSFNGNNGVNNQIYMVDNDMGSLPSGHETVYSELGEASENMKHHSLDRETKNGAPSGGIENHVYMENVALEKTDMQIGGVENQVYMEVDDDAIKQTNYTNRGIYSQLDQASENPAICQNAEDDATDPENVLYLEVNRDSSASKQDRRTSMNQTDSGKTATAKRKTVIFEPPAEETNELYLQLKRKNVKGIRRDCIIIGKTLGSGYFGNVHKAQMITESGSDDTIAVAVKTLNEKATERDKVKFLQEAAIMAQFDHTNVLKLYGVVVTKTSCMIVTELMTKGDLQRVLTKMRPDPGQLTNVDMPFTLLNICRQVCLGLSYLSQKGFVHRDIAARNILVNANNVCKVADFGLSRDLDEDDYYIANEGAKIPVKWTAPEALNYRKYSTASDVWSYGCLLYEIWSLGARPFQKMSNIQAFEKVNEGYRLPPPPGCSKEFYNLMIQCWHPDKEERPNFQGIMLVLLTQDKQILSIPEEDLSSHPLAGTIGATLQAGEKMYEKLQMTYV